MDALQQKIVLVTRRSRLDDLIARFNTLDQARFYVEHLGADFGDYEREHGIYRAALAEAETALQRFGRVQRLDRAFLPNFLFPPACTVVVVGQDGLVANTLKYLDGQPVIGVNPDPARWDGVLLPFRVADLKTVLPDVIAERRATRTVTMARAALSDGQVLHAVNDLFIGARSHVSARYALESAGQRETQSSSGIIVSTGLGSTGWFRSVLAGALGVTHAAPGPELRALREHGFAWESDHLQFAVREPFPSRSTQATLVFGKASRSAPLKIRSQMPENGVIFSDGVESDYLEFTAGMEATIDVAERRGHLVH